MSNQTEKHPFIDTSDINDVPPGKMKHIDVEKEEILLANSDDKLYALCDRCSHMNAPLSMGTLNGKVVTCPLHGARFDVTTGKKIGEPMAPDHQSSLNQYQRVCKRCLHIVPKLHPK